MLSKINLSFFKLNFGFKKERTVGFSYYTEYLSFEFEFEYFANRLQISKKIV